MEIQPPPISRREREIAIRVLMRSKGVRHWVESEAAFLKIKEGTPEYTKFFNEQARRVAKRLIEE